jgi:hypothetical protein
MKLSLTLALLAQWAVLRDNSCQLAQLFLDAHAQYTYFRVAAHVQWAVLRDNSCQLAQLFLDAHAHCAVHLQYFRVAARAQWAVLRDNSCQLGLRILTWTLKNVPSL